MAKKRNLSAMIASALEANEESEGDLGVETHQPHQEVPVQPQPTQRLEPVRVQQVGQASFTEQPSLTHRRQETMVPERSQNYHFDSPDSVPSKKMVAKIIQMIDNYRAMSQEVQRTAQTILGLTIDESDIESSSIYSLLIVDESKARAVQDIVHLRREEAVARAFTLMGYTEERLKSLSEHVALLIVDNNIYEIGPDSVYDNKIEFCRRLERGISRMNDKIVENLIPLAKLLNER